MRVTVNRINAALAAAGYPEVQIFRGYGYWYFNDFTLQRTIVYTQHLSSQTVEQWVESYRELLRENGKLDELAS